MNKVEIALQKAKKRVEPENFESYEKAFAEYSNWCNDKLNIYLFQNLFAFIVTNVEDKLKKPTTMNTKLSYIKNYLKSKKLLNFTKDQYQYQEIYDYLNVSINDTQTKSAYALSNEQIVFLFQKLQNFGLELLIKIAFIISVTGALRISQLHEIKFDSIKKLEDCFEITINIKKRKTKFKNCQPKTDTIFVSNEHFQKYYDLYKRII
jgi:hypothetical protein